MRKYTYLVWILVVIMIFTGCSSGNQGESDPPVVNETENGQGEENQEPEVEEVELKDIVDGTYETGEVTIGDIDKDGISVSIPERAYEEGFQLTVSESEMADYDSDDFDMLSQPVTILADGNHIRFDAPVLVTLKVDGLIEEKDDLSEYKAGYYNGEEWVMIAPESVDHDQGTISFYTYHFSPYLGMNAKEQKLITDWVSTQAIKKFGETKDKYVSELANQTIDLVLKKLNIKDTSATGKVIDSLRSDPEWDEMLKKYQKGDVEGMNQTMTLLVSKKIVENVPTSAMSQALETISGEAGVAWIESGTQAMGYAAEGKYKEAARIIGEKLSEDLLIVKAGKFAADTIQGQIDDWKDSEIEAAFQAYKKGADNYFFGYNVDAGDFESVWTQMRGIRRQLELEAIKEANDNRAEIGFPPLEDYEMEKIRLKVKRDYQEKFKARVANEKLIEEEKKNLELLVKEFNKQGFLGSSSKLSNLKDKGYSMGQQLEILKHFADKFMKDTGKTKLSSSEWNKHAEFVSPDYISQAARIYFTKGREAYNEYLAKEFNVALYPKIEDLAGTWTLTTTIVSVPDAFKEEGCELTEGDVESETVRMEQVSATRLKFVGDEDTDPVYFDYKDGKLTVVSSEDVASVDASWSMDAIMTDNGAKMTGSLKFGDERGFIEIETAFTR